jgi:hypothetical protein
VLMRSAGEIQDLKNDVVPLTMNMQILVNKCPGSQHVSASMK